MIQCKKKKVIVCGWLCLCLVYPLCLLKLIWVLVAAGKVALRCTWSNGVFKGLDKITFSHRVCV